MGHAMSNFFWCVINGASNINFFWPRPLGPGEESKGQISFNFNYKVNFKDFYAKLCACFTTKTYANCLSLIIIFQYAFCARNVASAIPIIILEGRF